MYEVKANNYAQYFCQQLVQRLIDSSIDHFFIGSGSRSIPLISALARNNRAKVFMGIDERSIGFMALGFAKATQQPAVIVVTSGTAVANLAPAICEAFIGQVPLLVLSADRPYELRDCGANQTMAQAYMFANHVNKSFDLGPPSPMVALRQSIAIIDQAVSASLRPKKGPVHLNLQLREPVTNVAHEKEGAFEVETLPPLLNLSPRPGVNSDDVRAIMAELGKHDRGLIAVGELMPSLVQQKILSFARALGWPVFADVSSNLRFCQHENLCGHFDLVLVREDKPKFSLVLKLGARILSKRFWLWVEGTSSTHTQFISLNENAERIDHTGAMTQINVHDLEHFLDLALADLGLMPATRSLTAIDDSFVRREVALLMEHKNNNEAYVAHRLIANITEPSILFLSSSMPVRDVDQFASHSSVPIDTYVNRGVSGIDGIISSAVGLALGGRHKPLIVLLGDMAFLHDSNGLMLLAQSDAPILIVVVNNGGGGIFHFLPVAKEPEVLSPYVDMPHKVELKKLSEAHRLIHQTMRDVHDFDVAMQDFFINKKSKVLELIIDRDENVRLHKNFFERLR